MEIKILKAHEINQPRVKALVHETHPKDWIQGDAVLGTSFVNENLFPDKDLTPYITELNDLQRNISFDEFFCVIHGTINNVQLLINKKYGVKIDFSKRDLGLKIPVTRGQGTSIRACSECLRTQGVALEKDYPTITPSMTEDEFWTPMTGVKEFFLANGYEYNHINLPTSWLGASMESIIESGLVQSGVIVAIEGRYTFDDQDRLQYAGGAYTHVVLVVKSQPDCFLVLDSENPQGLMKVRRDYNFSSPKIASVNQKKSMKYKITGNNAVFYLDPVGNVLVPFGSGKVYKTIQGEDSYKGIVEVPDFKALLAIAPFADYIISESPWDSTSFTNSLI